MAIRPQVPYVAVMTSPVAISRPPWHLNFGKGCPSSLPGSHKQKFWNFIFSNLCVITRSLLGKRGAGFTLGPSAYQSSPCTTLTRAVLPLPYSQNFAPRFSEGRVSKPSIFTSATSTFAASLHCHPALILGGKEPFILKPFFEGRCRLKSNSPARFDIDDRSGLRIPSFPSLS